MRKPSLSNLARTTGSSSPSIWPSSVDPSERATLYAKTAMDAAHDATGENVADLTIDFCRRIRQRAMLRQKQNFTNLDAIIGQIVDCAQPIQTDPVPACEAPQGIARLHDDLFNRRSLSQRGGSGGPFGRKGIDRWGGRG